jgi:thioesterase domain-containing protein
MYVNDDGGQPAPVGIPGELYVGGEGMARGYIGREELTAERFIPARYGRAGERLYKTGDLVRYLSDGNIEYLGRKDAQVKIRGYRIELGEIQAVLSEHRSVNQSVVIAREDERGDNRLLGYVVVEEATSTSELRKYLKERLPEYMLPEAIIALDEVPVTANGKIDRKKLPPPSGARQLLNKSIVDPRDHLELQLVNIWENVLGVHPIGATDNFFDLGGHSLLAVSLMARIRNVMGRDLPLSALFQGGTIESLASMLRRESNSASWSCLVELQASGSQPPLFFVHPAGGNVLCYLDLARRLGRDQPFYGLMAPGLNGEQSLYTRVEDLAAHYIETLKTVQPEGPYILGGWSFGGIVAYEMAQQLVAQGQKVSHLLLLDSGARTSSGEDIEDEVEDDDAALLVNLLSEDLPISTENLRQFQGDEQIDYILKRAMEEHLAPPDVEVAQARSLLRVYRTNEKAGRKYVPQVYPDTITLFKTAKPTVTPSSDGSAASERMKKIIQDPTMGWGELVAGGVRVVDVPGTHITMVRPPHIETLAMRIRACLNGELAPI